MEKTLDSLLGLLLLTSLFCCGQAQGAALTTEPNWLTFYSGEFVTFRCDMNEGENSDWEYKLNRNNGSYLSIKTDKKNTFTFLLHSGEYQCCGRKRSSDETKCSNTVTVSAEKPMATLTADSTTIPVGGSVTLSCSVEPSAGWKYRWFRRTKKSPEAKITANNEQNRDITVTQRGIYRCQGVRGNPGFISNPSSNVSIKTTSSPPQPVLSVSPSWLNPGASVTLSCEGLKHQPAGWRFFWYKAVPDPSSSSYTYELLPNSTNGTEQNSFIINGPTHTAGFVCRAGRGGPKFYTHYSEPKFVWSADPGPAASFSVNPDRVQHFRSESVSLSCEGNFAEWRVRRFTEAGHLLDCFYGGRMNGSTCTIEPFYFSSGVFWCESNSGEFSNAINITVLYDYYDGIILLSPVHPVTEGDPVTLRCRDKDHLLSNVFFYHNDKLIHDGSREELNISAVSKSDEGFYKCQHSGKDSPRSWMSVRVTSPVSSLFLMLLIIGPVVRIVLIFLLLLFLCCRRNNVADGPSDATYSQIELRDFRENYSTPTYANINYQKKKKGNRSPAATDADADAVYSEIGT
ncbi:obscurin-like isoform X1 [Poecilia reticulata]|uniref:obscurin-like isoform X1 n=1 Tax=Poecilia reticulata TaxID=8081 RepID=UPI0007EA8196|nr:PREDICTED: obscurin-like isoform X1 [Poecilia reticulata]XP_017163923.1 PREDICTED: obscurin-like isoform X1 [Poecilia reticulata]